MNEFNFNFFEKGKIALITGSTGNLGKRIAENFSKFKTNLILIDINEKKLNKQKKLLKKKYNNKIKTYYCDFSKSDNRDLVLKKIFKENKKIDIIINNASMVGDMKLKNWNSKVSEQNIYTWKKCFTINLESIYSTIKILEKRLRNSKDPCIVNIGSIYGFLAPDYEIYKNTNINNPVAYSVSKGGLITLTKLFASYLAPKIRVNCLSPGGILRKQSRNFIKNYVATVPLKRMASEEDVVNVILFLSCKMSKYITGQNIVVDGGKSII